MTSRYLRILSILLVVALAGCSGLPFGSGNGQKVTPTSLLGTRIPNVSLTLAARLTGTPAGPDKTQIVGPVGGLTIRIWLPPEFDPEEDSSASSLLKARLEQFAGENPGIRLEVRLKALEGNGGLLESLATASVAAPLVLPDLVLLPNPLLESAALKGLLYPYDGLTSVMDDPNWYEYARQLAHVQSSIYGIPFAGDALVLAYHPSLIEKPSFRLADFLPSGQPMLFPATDPQALFTLCLYLAENGSLQDAQGRPSLDAARLAEIFTFDQQASQAGVMPYWLTQYSNDSQIWEAFQGDQYPMAVVWASTYLSHLLAAPGDLELFPVPTASGTPFTLASGWSWALAGQDPVRRTLAIKLAEYLVEAEFLGKWTYAAGYLPPRGIPLQYWPEEGLRSQVADISLSATLMPPVDLLSTLGPALEQALVNVLKAQADPQSAAQSVVSQINRP